MTDEEVWDMFNEFSAEVAHAERLLDDNDLDVDLVDLLPVTQKWNAVLMALALYHRGEEE